MGLVRVFRIFLVRNSTIGVGAVIIITLELPIDR